MTIVVAPAARSRRQGGGRVPLVAIAQVRLMVLALLFGAVAFAILVKLTVLALHAAPLPKYEPGKALIPARADITDRNGQTLAQSIQGWSIAIHPNGVISKKSDLAKKLAQVFPERSEAQYFAMLNTDDSFEWLRRRVTPAVVNAANALGEPAIEALPESDRLYPQGQLASHILGYLRDGKGFWGMEKVLEDRLASKEGRAAPAALSIDMRVQGVLENELVAASDDLQPRGASGVILDVNTGEVIAMASLPTFNPNALNAVVPRNNVTQSTYELGSTFKPIAVAAAIDSGKITSMTRRFDATEPLQVGRYKLKDDPGDEQFRWLNIPETLVYSSNIATARIADEIGQDTLIDMFHRLGFDQPATTELQAGAKPQWPGYWSRVGLMTSAYGHGIAVTPLHLANAYAAMVNGGIFRPATLVKADPKHPVEGRRVLQESTSMRIRQLLRLIVLRGTGRNADVPGMRIAGKTGTAEAASNGGYDKHRNVSTFAAAFPIDAPRYVIVVVMDSPKANARVPRTTAAWTAAPVVRRVVARTGPLLGIIPDTSRDIDTSELLPLIGGEKGEKPKKQ